MYGEISEQYKLALKEKIRLDIAQEIHTLASEVSDGEEWRRGESTKTISSKCLLLLVIDLLIWEFLSIEKPRSLHQNQLVNTLRSAFALLLSPFSTRERDTSLPIMGDSMATCKDIQNHPCLVNINTKHNNFLRKCANEGANEGNGCDSNSNHMDAINLEGWNEIEDACCRLIKTISKGSMELEGIKISMLIFSSFSWLKLNRPLMFSLIASIRAIFIDRGDKSRMLVITAALQFLIFLFESEGLIWLCEDGDTLLELLEETVALLPFVPLLGARVFGILVYEIQWSIPVAPRILEAMSRGFILMIEAIEKSTVAFSAMAPMLVELIKPLWSHHLTKEQQQQLEAMALGSLTSKREPSLGLHRLISTIFSLKMIDWSVKTGAFKCGLISKQPERISLETLDLESESGLRILSEAVNGVGYQLHPQWTSMMTKFPSPTVDLLRREGMLSLYVSLASQWGQLAPVFSTVTTLLSWAGAKEGWRSIARHLLSPFGNHLNSTLKTRQQCNYPSKIHDELNTSVDRHLVKQAIEVISQNPSPMDIWLLLELSIHFDTDADFVQSLDRLSNICLLDSSDSTNNMLPRLHHNHIALQWFYVRSITTSNICFWPLLLPHHEHVVTVSSPRTGLLLEYLGKLSDPLIVLFTMPSSISLIHLQDEVIALDSNMEMGATALLPFSSLDIPPSTIPSVDLGTPTFLVLSCIRIGLVARMILEMDPTCLPEILDILLSIFERKDIPKTLMAELIERWILELVLFGSPYVKKISLIPLSSIQKLSNNASMFSDASVTLALEVRSWLQVNGKRRSILPHPQSIAGMELFLRQYVGKIGERFHLNESTTPDGCSSNVCINTEYECRSMVEDPPTLFDGYCRWLQCRDLAAGDPLGWAVVLQGLLRNMMPICRLPIPLFPMKNSSISKSDGNIIGPSLYAILEGMAYPWNDAICLRQLSNKREDIHFWLQRLEGKRQFGPFLAILLWNGKEQALLFRDALMGRDRDLLRQLLISGLDATISALLFFFGNAQLTTSDVGTSSITTCNGTHLRTTLELLARMVSLDSPEALFTTSTTRCWHILWMLRSSRHHPSLAAVTMLHLNTEKLPQIQKLALDIFMTLAPTFAEHALPQLLFTMEFNLPLISEESTMALGLVLSAFLAGTSQAMRHSASEIDSIVEETRMALLELTSEHTPDTSTRTQYYLACFRASRRIKQKHDPSKDLTNNTSIFIASGRFWISTLVLATKMPFLIHALRAAIGLSTEEHPCSNIDELFLDKEVPFNDDDDCSGPLLNSDIPNPKSDCNFVKRLILFLILRWPELVEAHLKDAPPFAKFLIGKILINLELSNCKRSPSSANVIMQNLLSESYQSLLQAALYLPRISMGWEPAEVLFLLLVFREKTSFNEADFLHLEENMLMEMPELLGSDILPGHLIAAKDQHGKPPSHLLTSWNMSESNTTPTMAFDSSIHQSSMSKMTLSSHDERPFSAATDMLTHSLIDACHSWKQGHANWAISLLQHALATYTHFEVVVHDSYSHTSPSNVSHQLQPTSHGSFNSASENVAHMNVILTLAKWTAEARAAGPMIIDRLYRYAEAVYFETGGSSSNSRDCVSTCGDPVLPWRQISSMKDNSSSSNVSFGASLYAAWGFWADDAAQRSMENSSLVMVALRAYAASLSLQSGCSQKSIEDDIELKHEHMDRDCADPLLLTLRVAHLWFREGDKVDAYVRKWFGDDGIVTPEIWLVLVHQLAARLGPKQDASCSKDDQKAHLASQHVKAYHNISQALVQIYKRMVLAYPFVALYPLFYVLGGPAKAKASIKSRESTAAQLLAELVVSPIAAELRAAMQLAEASVELGVRLPPAGTNGPFALDSSWHVVRISRNGGLIAPVLTTTSFKTSTVHSLPRVVGWAERVRVLNGINAPKALECYGSDGRSYPQLFKARDDLRQDALVLQVMQCLGNAGEGRITTQLYPVIPLQKFVGVIGMLPDTLVLGDWLVEAHLRLRPNDMRPEQAVRLMADIRKCHDQKGVKRARGHVDSDGVSTSKDRDQLLMVFQAIRSSFTPVLRHFFWEADGCKWSEDGVCGWLQARVAYSESVGISSILGWMVGLGDRHPQNILISRESGTLCHIDLNLIFDAGRHLKVPELVPFRLTPDICDGLLRQWRNGPTRHANTPLSSIETTQDDRPSVGDNGEVENFPPLEDVQRSELHSWPHLNSFPWSSSSPSSNGIPKKGFSGTLFLPLGIFGRAATRTLLALRGRSELICMLFEAFRHDPLYVQWRNSPGDADRDLARLRERLAPSSLLSAEAQVNALVREAIDEQALAAMYHGWQAWM